jgi:hypothetical protein
MRIMVFSWHRFNALSLENQSIRPEKHHERGIEPQPVDTKPEQYFENSCPPNSNHWFHNRRSILLMPDRIFSQSWKKRATA